MQNAEGQVVDLYIPRKCSWSNRLLTADDKGSVQVNVADIDPVTGKYTKSYATFAISGYMRQKAESDEALFTLAKRNDASK
mmetsp:Transcript_39584/g.51864  ORF Transcript_39584/g.51864 Transcript_39584/m.51864 type:complete len:81 (-) Transcript_39584:8-250(-)